jgi:hypothetical protein
VVCKAASSAGSSQRASSFDAVLRVAHDHVALAGKPDRLDDKRGLLGHLTGDRLQERLAGFDRAARQCIKIERRLARAPHHQHLAVAENGRADRENWTLRIGSLVGHRLAGSDRFGVDRKPA